MIAELWGGSDGQIYYRLDNWGGFYRCIPDKHQHPGNRVSRGEFEDLMETQYMICLMRDGDWTGNFIGPQHATGKPSDKS